MRRKSSVALLIGTGLLVASCNSAPDLDPSVERNTALRVAQERLADHNYSQYRLQTWLTTSAGGNFSDDAAAFAAERVDADWSQRAEDTANNYLKLVGLTPEQTLLQMTADYGDRIPEDIARTALQNAVGAGRINQSSEDLAVS